MASTDPWRYDTAMDLDQSLLERLRRFPREPDMLRLRCARPPRSSSARGCGSITG